MEILERGDLVVVKFPFSDLSGAKLRPGLVVGKANRGDFILCQLTSRNYNDDGIAIDPTKDVTTGKLRDTSYARPLKLFTANEQIIKGVIGRLSGEKLNSVIEKIVLAVQGRKF